MRIKTIQFLPEDQWLAARITLEPKGTLTLRVRRNSGHIWSVRKSRGEATLAVYVTPDRQTYYQDELESLAQELSLREFLGVGGKGQLLFDQGVEAQPSAHLEPSDLLDNSRDDIRYTADVPIPGLGAEDHPAP